MNLILSIICCSSSSRTHEIRTLFCKFCTHTFTSNMNNSPSFDLSQFSTLSCETICFSEQAKSYPSRKCGLTAIPIQVPYPTDGFSIPSFIELHRCLGGCPWHSPSLFHCVAQTSSDVLVSSYDVRSTPTNEAQVNQKVTKLLNHTQCDCQCIVQEHHCNNATETYDAKQCKCVCKDLTHTCDSTIKVTISIYIIRLRFQFRTFQFWHVSLPVLKVKPWPVSLTKS